MANDTENASVKRVDPGSQGSHNTGSGGQAKPAVSADGDTEKKNKKGAKGSQDEGSSGGGVSGREAVESEDIESGKKDKSVLKKAHEAGTVAKMGGKALAGATKGMSGAGAMGAHGASLGSMLSGMISQIGSMLASGLTSLGSMLGGAAATMASAIGVSMATAAFGALGLVAAIGVAIVVAVTAAVNSDTADSAQRDAGVECNEDYDFVYESTPTGDQKDSAQKIWSILKSYGFKNTNIAGVLGNWEIESGLDPTAIEVLNGDYSESFVDMLTKTEGTYMHYKPTFEAHEACQCEWLVKMIEKGEMEVVETTDDGQPIKYKYKYQDIDYDDQGQSYMEDGREFEYCWNCDEGYEVPCEHGYTESHYYNSGSMGQVLCTAGYKVECEHDFTEKHHVPAYHSIDLRTRCMDYKFTPPGVVSEGQETGLDENGNVLWVLPDDESIPFYDHEDGISEGYRKYSTNSSYHTVYVGIGLGQWTNGRNKMLRRFATDNGMDWWTLDCQMAFLLSTEGDKGAAQNWLLSWAEEPDPEQAARDFSSKWEGNTHSWQERAKKAASWYVEIKSWESTGVYDAAYGQSILDMAQQAVNAATNKANEKSFESCGYQINADNSNIASAAVAFAWENTGLANNDGTALWRCEKDEILGDTDGHGMEWKYKSCDRTVATAVRISGADYNYPAGPVTAQKAYLQSHTEKWAKIAWDGNVETLSPGDIMIHCEGDSHHTMIYVGNDAIAEKYPDLKGTGYCIVDGSLGTRSPACKQFSSSAYTKEKYDIYRCYRRDGAPLTAGCAGCSGTSA